MTEVSRLDSKLAWAAWIDGLLERTELTAGQLADIIGVSPQLLSFWRKERHAQMPTEENQQKLLTFARQQGWVE